MQNRFGEQFMEDHQQQNHHLRKNPPRTEITLRNSEIAANVLLPESRHSHPSHPSTLSSAMH
jgi:hypothetical protein